jgi:hypothetical protein
MTNMNNTTSLRHMQLQFANLELRVISMSEK